MIFGVKFSDINLTHTREYQRYKKAPKTTKGKREDNSGKQNKRKGKRGKEKEKYKYIYLKNKLKYGSLNIFILFFK